MDQQPGALAAFQVGFVREAVKDAAPVQLRAKLRAFRGVSFVALQLGIGAVDAGIFHIGKHPDVGFHRSRVVISRPFPHGIERGEGIPLGDARRKVGAAANFAPAPVAVKIRHGDEPGDAFHQKVVGDPVHDAGGDAVGIDVETFAQGVGATAADGGGLSEARPEAVGPGRIALTPDDIDAGRVKGVQTADEISPRTVDKKCVFVVQMPLQRDVMLRAPASQHLRIVPGEEFGTDLEVFSAGVGGAGEFAGALPQEGQDLFGEGAVIAFAGDLLHFGGEADGVFPVAEDPPEGFVGEDPPDGFAELRAQLAEAGFIGHRDEILRRLLPQKVGKLLRDFGDGAVLPLHQKAGAVFGVFLDHAVETAARGPAAFVVKHHGKIEAFALLQHDMGKLEIAFAEPRDLHALQERLFMEAVRQRMQIDAVETGFLHALQLTAHDRRYRGGIPVPEDTGRDFFHSVSAFVVQSASATEKMVH